MGIESTPLVAKASKEENSCYLDSTMIFATRRHHTSPGKCKRRRGCAKWEVFAARLPFLLLLLIDCSCILLLIAFGREERIYGNQPQKIRHCWRSQCRAGSRCWG